FFASLGQLLPAEPVPYPAEVSNPATVGDVLGCFQVPESLARLVLLNGRHVAWSDPVSDGDKLSVFPPIGGG
ncbi:MAG: MoaD/ThiS family protein, partial [Lentisphaerae bacterium]|nr:MoaD/ThiS family protein [Lentisphaerota bacterium]